MIESAWEKLQVKFPDIICNNKKYYDIVRNIILSPNNILVYCAYGFPIDLMIEVVLMQKFNKKKFYRTPHIWNKSIHYIENQYFIEIDLMNPENIKNIEKITNFLLHIVNAKSIDFNKHLIILKHINLLYRHYYEFRILLERFQNNITFIATTHHVSKIEMPILSRFRNFRIPLFSFEEIKDIYKNDLDMSINEYLAITKTRDIIKCIFITDNETRLNSKELITKSFINYNYPPFVNFVKTFNSKNLEEIRILSYKCCQYNITISKIIHDFIKLVDDDGDHYFNIKYPKIAKKNYKIYKDKLKMKIIEIGTNTDYMLSQTNKCKEPIYIENLLCQLLI
tara:strand:- start:2547 stop:3560 length:1014 start_codon:yes stop_codon:yes gene_type:complete